MPTITVEMLKGRTPEQLQEFTDRATDLAVDVLKAARDKVKVRFVENEPSSEPKSAAKA
jgi:phenylpyruvate tautomerase PptA (4-oxalocrotonate tautomerase family)